MDPKKVMDILATDPSLGGTVFMDLLKRTHDINKREEALGIDDSTAVARATEHFLSSAQTIMKEGNLTRLQNLCLEGMMLDFKLVCGKVEFFTELARFNEKLFLNTEEGKFALDLALTTFADPAKARDYVIASGIAKEK